MAKLLHTADWHLGKRLRDFWLLEEQREALERLVDVIDAERPDALIVAGDVFDAPVPSIRALQLWEWAVDRIVGDLRVPTVVIPGNHDHAERIAMNARLARHAGLHLRNELGACHEPVRIAGVDLFCVPFHKPPHVRALANLEAEAAAADRPTDPQGGLFDAAPPEPLGDFDYDAAMGRLLDRARACREPGVPAVLIAHAFVDGAGEEPEGEEAITVGGVGGVRPATFHGFDYVALGHVHGARTFRGPAPVRYAGSLYPCAFGESCEKSVTIVEFSTQDGEGAAPAERTAASDAGTAAEAERTGRVATRTVPIEARRRVRIVEDRSFDEVLEAGLAARRAKEAGTAVDEDPDDYLLVRVSDRQPIDHALARLREVHPNALLEQPTIRVDGHERRLSGDARAISVERAFLDFYESVFGEEPGELEATILREALGEDEREESEDPVGSEA